MEFNQLYEKKIKDIDSYIKDYLSNQKNIEHELKEAVVYSVINGGKRLRSILCTEICTILGGSYETALPFAAAIEFVHAYSLVHDDLPCMDNADMRRGQPSCHKKFGEGCAVLTGDGLLNLAFEIMAEQCEKGVSGAVKALSYISRCTGIHGMVNGQAIDLKLPGRTDISEAELLSLIEQKTVALIRAAAVSGTILSGNTDAANDMEEYAYNLGMAFQIRDDFEDEIQDSTEGTDCPNFINILGRDEALKRLDIHQKKAYNIISKYDENSFLCLFHKYLFG